MKLDQLNFTACVCNCECDCVCVVGAQIRFSTGEEDIVAAS